MITKEVYRNYLKLLLAGERKECNKIITDLLENKVEFKDLYNHLFQRSLYKAGELWENNIISVANEYLATAITESLMVLVYPYLFATDRVGRNAVISCSANEYHQIGGKMAADLLELNSWDTYYLGANLPS